MNNKTDIDVKYVSPLKKICMTIGELPASYLETMSYYEMLVWFTEFLKNQVIPAVNTNAEAVSELQALYEELRTYVNDYFDNLDIAEEVDNKLDQMAESGQLTDIIAQYLGLAGMIAYDTVADMKVAENLVNGSKCRTLGFHSVNDNGGAYYKIRTVTNDDVVDEMTIIEVYDDTLVAELIKEDSMNPKQFGAYGDGVHDDTLAIQTACNYNSVISFTDGIYMINAVTHINLNDNNILNLNNAVLKAISTDNDHYTIININECENIKIYNGTIQGDKESHLTETGEWGMCISITDSTNILIENTKLIDAWGDGIYINGCNSLNTSNLVIDNARRNGISVISAQNYTSLNDTISNISGTNPQAGIDFEPNYNTDKISNIKLINLKTKNTNIGTIISLHNLDSTSQFVTMVIENLIDENSNDGIRFVKSNSVTGDITINGIKLYNNPDNPIAFRNYAYNQNFLTTINNIFIKRSSATSTGNDYACIRAYGTNASGNIILKNYKIYQDGISNTPDLNLANTKEITLDTPIHKTSGTNITSIDKININDPLGIYSFKNASGGGTIGSYETRLISIKDETSSSNTNVSISGNCPIGFYCEFSNLSAGNYSVYLPADHYCLTYSNSAAPRIALAKGATLKLKKIDSSHFIVQSSSGTITLEA